LYSDLARVPVGDIRPDCQFKTRLLWFGMCFD
jgi:hypothetical protein